LKKPNKEALVISRHIRAFLNEDVDLQQTLSEHTLKSYNDALSLYISFLHSEKGINSTNLSGECFTVQYIRERLQWLMESRGCSPETCNSRLGSLRAFLNYLAKREKSFSYLAFGALQIERIQGTPKKVEALSKDAVRALLRTPDLSTKTGRRDAALLMLMYGTAARINEILSLKVGHLHLKTKKPCVDIIGKGGKQRTLYLLPNSVAHLTNYLEEFHGKTPNSESYVFYSSGDGGKMSQIAIANRLKKYAEIAHKECLDAPPTLRSEQLRHAKAAHLLQDGMNVLQISFLLGHKNPDTTLEFLGITIQEAEKSFATEQAEKSSPKDENDWFPSVNWKESNDLNDLSEICGLKSIKSKS
jgi:site-specific recombinase XerD